MNLLQRLIQANYQTLAINDERDTSYVQLIEQALQLRQLHPYLQQQTVALSYSNLNDFSVALIAFDGWCNALYLLPEPTLLLPESTIHWPTDTPVSVSSLKQNYEDDAQTQWYLATSGTTGTPKWINHSFNSLSRAIKISATTNLHWALCYQATRFAGLQVLLQSIVSGAIVTDCSIGEPEQRIALMQKHAINAISATPSLWRQLLMTGQLNTLSLQQLTLGGEIADQVLLDTLSALFPSAKLLHIYASTEAGVGFAVADKQAGFPVSWLSEKTNGIRFKIDDKQHLWLKTPCSSDLHLAALQNEHGFIDTTDLVSIAHDRVFFLGRASGVINVGGNKVHPEQVEQVLLQHPAVLQTKVYAKASSVLGQLVVADIVINHVNNRTSTSAEYIAKNNAEIKRQLLQHCQQQLLRYQVPTRFNFVSTLTTNASGKLNRQTQERES
ncbi:AMP-binding protein [Rheinheimera metallidurans]|uniref:AMP-binding protein n=1 Tax=Rheinheimera metallidurans TaxID=2925781 RepID=UPI0030019F43